MPWFRGPRRRTNCVPRYNKDHGRRAPPGSISGHARSRRSGASAIAARIMVRSTISGPKMWRGALSQAMTTEAGRRGTARASFGAKEVARTLRELCRGGQPLGSWGKCEPPTAAEAPCPEKRNLAPQRAQRRSDLCKFRPKAKPRWTSADRGDSKEILKYHGRLPPLERPAGTARGNRPRRSAIFPRTFARTPRQDQRRQSGQYFSRQE